MVSHDRYFLERVCDTFVGLLGDLNLQDLPRGIDQYLELRNAQIATSSPAQANETVTPSGNQFRENKKEVQKLEKEISRIDTQIAKLHAEMVEKSTDFTALKDLNQKLSELESAKDQLEEKWLELHS